MLQVSFKVSEARSIHDSMDLPKTNLFLKYNDVCTIALYSASTGLSLCQSVTWVDSKLQKNLNLSNVYLKTCIMPI